MGGKLSALSKLKGFLCLVFAPQRLQALQKKHGSDAASGELLRRQLFSSLILVLTGVTTGAVSAYIMSLASWRLLETGRDWLLVAALALILWSAVVRLGGPIQTWNGESYSEQVDAFSFKVFAWCGTALAVFATVAPR